MQALVGRPFHPTLGLGKDIDRRQNAIRLISRARSQQGLPKFGRNPLAVGRRIQLRHEQGTQASDQLAQQLRKIATTLGFFLDQRQRSRRVARQQGSGEIRHLLARSEPENIEHIFLNDPVTAECHQLIQHRLRVTHAAIGPLGDRPRGRLIKINALLARNVQQVIGNQLRRNRPQIETLTPRQNRRQNFVRLGGRKYEFHMRRRLFERLEQGIERRIRKHVDLVDVIDPKLTPTRRKFHRIPQLAHLLDAIV